jgi:hypothetical protein
VAALVFTMPLSVRAWAQFQNHDVAGQTLARWVAGAAPYINLGNTKLAFAPDLDFSTPGAYIQPDTAYTAEVHVAVKDDKADTYFAMTQPDGDLVSGHWTFPYVGGTDTVTTSTDNALLCRREYFPMWLTVESIMLRGVVGADSGSDDTLSFAIYEDADAGVQLTEGEGADLTTTANVELDVANVTIGPGMYRFCGCAQDVSGAAFHATALDDEAIDVMNEGVVTFGTAANACVAGDPPATTGAISTADDAQPVFKLSGTAGS